MDADPARPTAREPSPAPLPDPLPLRPTGPVDVEITVPGSKSLTNRAFAVAALADGVSVLEGALLADDQEVMVEALRRLGFRIDEDGTTFTVEGRGGRIPAREAELDLRLSGTSIRFLAALCAAGRGTYRLDGNRRMRERPIRDLLEAIEALGGSARSEAGNGCPPVVIEARGLDGGRASVAGGRSSQYLSGLLMAAPYARGPVELVVEDELQSKPFVDMTLRLMADFGVTVERDGYRRFRVEPGRYAARRYAVEGDAMAAGYFWAAAAVTGGRALVTNVGDRSTQGDRRLADVLGEMGCTVAWTGGSCEVRGPAGGRLRGGTFDLNDMPDQAQTLAACALFADGPVRIENVWNLRIKETDRIEAMATELRRLGAEVVAEPDALEVRPPVDPAALRGARLATYGDHRMAMALAVAGLRVPGVEIEDPACTAKTYPGFFADWAALGGVDPEGGGPAGGDPEGAGLRGGGAA